MRVSIFLTLATFSFPHAQTRAWANRTKHCKQLTFLPKPWRRQWKRALTKLSLQRPT